jgi:hypothetical protein
MGAAKNKEQFGFMLHQMSDIAEHTFIHDVTFYPHLQFFKFIDQIKNDLITHYQTIWDSRSRQEQQILKKLSHPKISKYELQMNDMIVRELAEVNNNKYVTFSQFFGELVQHSFMIKGRHKRV